MYGPEGDEWCLWWSEQERGGEKGENDGSIGRMVMEQRPMVKEYDDTDVDTEY